MNTVFTLLESPPSMDLPIGPLGWIGLLCFSMIIATLQVFLRGYNKPWGKNERLWFILLLVLTPLTSLLLGVRLPVSDALPPPGIPVDIDGPAAMLLAAVPWMLAGGLLGPFPALLIALLAGVTRSLWGTHNLYTIVEIALLATLFSAFVNQRYRTYFYNLLRHPFITALSLALIYPFIYLTSALFSTQGELVNRLDYAVTNLIAVSLAVGIELIIAGVISEGIKISAPDAWVSDKPLVPAPEERSLLTRFIYYLSPIALALILALIISNWIVAGNAARGMLKERMSDTTTLVADNIPYFINTGQNLITSIASDPGMLSDDSSKIYKLLEEYIRTSAFFDQLVLLDERNIVIAAYPDSDQSGHQAPVEEQMAFLLALQGVSFQTSTVGPTEDQTTAQASFMATVPQEGQVKRVLVGRSELGNNPLVEPLITSLYNAAGENGRNYLLDQDYRYLIHENKEQVLSRYTGPTSDEPIFNDNYVAPDGTRSLLYFQPISGHPWFVLLMKPASEAQQLTLTIAAPIIGVIYQMLLCHYL